MWDDETSFNRGLPSAEEVQREPTRRERAYLIFLAGANVGEMVKLGKEAILIGRGDDADVRVQDGEVSRAHAKLVLSGTGEIRIEDLGSRNGTFVNGNRISAHVLRDGDKIKVGSTTILKFTYHDDLEETFQRQMYEAALRDALTNAYNRRYFFDRIETEFKFATRHNNPLSLLMLDIDHFKKINDTHGHVAGDLVLTRMGKRAQELLRTEDLFARYGGEEFAVICRGTDIKGAQRVAERLRSEIARLDIRNGDTGIPITVSIGVAGIPEIPVVSPLDLIQAADRALYEAKHGGRNCVRTAVP